MSLSSFSWNSFFVAIAGILIALAQITYIRDTVRRKVTPSILSWLGWALLMGTSLVAVCIGEGWNQSLIGLSISIAGCLLIAVLAFSINNYALKEYDWKFVIAGVICILLYLSTKNPWATTLFAIAADFALAIPTFMKAWKNPASEKTSSWIYGSFSWSITLCCSLSQDFIYVLWPLYLFCFNLTMLYLSHIRK